MLFCVVCLNLYGHCNISKTLYTEWNTNSCFANTNTKRMWAREHILNWPNAIAPCILFLYYFLFVDLNDWKLITCIKVVNHQIDEQHTQLDIYTSACLKALKYCWFPAFFMCKTRFHVHKIVKIPTLRFW